MRKNWVRRIIATGLCLCLLPTALPVSAMELQDQPLAEKFGGISGTLVDGTTQYTTYANYRQALPAEYLTEAVSLTAELASAEQKQQLEGKEAYHWTDDVS